MPHRWVILIFLLGGVTSRPLFAQRWNDAEAITLIDRAIRQRWVAISDSTLQSYQALAHGIVTFSVGLGDDPNSQLVKADELAVEVYWRQHQGSKQRISAWRDSTFLPSEFRYHRDHLGIVTDDFGPIIRLGDGDEVRDVVHPLASNGPAQYDYRVRDTILIAQPTGTIKLVSIEVRPKDPKAAGVVGAVMLDVERAELVRSEFTFTAAAYRDSELEDITVRLERSLFEGRYWLPYRQEIEIRRRSPVLDFPIQGVIRAVWTIDDYTFNEEIPPARLVGPPIGGMRSPAKGGTWSGSLVASLDSSAKPGPGQMTPDEVRAYARRLIRSRVLSGLPATRLAISGLSQVARVNRVEGLRLGAGLTGRVPLVERGQVHLWYGTADHRLTGSTSLEQPVRDLVLELSAKREIVDVGEHPGASGLINSFAAQEAGRDYGDYLLLERIGLSVGGPRQRGLKLEMAREWSRSVAVRARPASGQYRDNAAFGTGPYWTGAASVMGEQVKPSGEAVRWSVRGEIGAGTTEYLRLSSGFEMSRPVRAAVLGVQGFVGFGSAELPARRSFQFGGPGTITGLPFRGYGGRQVAWGRGELLFRVPGPGFSVHPYGQVPARAMVGPMIGAGQAWGDVVAAPWRAGGGPKFAVGIAAELFSRLVRLEFATSVDHRGPATISVDFSKSWWRIL